MKPLLAANAELEDVKFPCYASHKLDGIRALVKDGVLVSRTLKPIPNRYAQELFGRPEYEGFDGELIVGYPNDKDVYNKTQSGVMSKEGESALSYYVFDMWNMESGYDIRKVAMVNRMADLFHKQDRSIRLVHPVLQVEMHNKEELQQYEEQALSAGYEGVIVRSIEGRYKFGRSTKKEGILLKLKRFLDAEAEVIGIKEMMHNDNLADVSELGYVKRSTHKENMIPTGKLGAFIVRDLETGVEFDVGSGLTEQQRRELFTQDVVRRIVKYKYFPVGVKEKPRQPIFLGFRTKDDM